MKTGTRGIRLVTFEPNDYSLSEVLTLKNASIESDPRTISAALSLYFQWPEHRRAVLYTEKSTEIHSMCEISFDQDEREPTELFLDILLESNEIRSGSTVRVRFEVFRACYEIVVEISSIESANGKLFASSSVPSEIAVFKYRKLPRVDIPEESQFKLVFKTDSLDDSELTPMSLSMRSILASSTINLEVGTRGKVCLDDIAFEAEVVRYTDGIGVFKLHFANGYETGRYFEIYRKIAFPSLVPRFEFPEQTFYDLYKSSGYIDRYLSNESDVDILYQMKQVWNQTKSGFHKTVADYFVVNPENEPVGTSSCVLAHQQNGIDLWTWHQYCSTRNPENIKESGQLYQWRAEYLAGRPEPFRIMGWFSSKGRWLERIFVKFQNISQDSTTLKAVKIINTSFEPKKEYSAVEMTLGEATRWAVDCGDVFGGINPERLNMGQILNGIIACEDDSDKEIIDKVGSSLAFTSGKPEPLYVTVPFDFNWNDSINHEMNGDRYMSFDKECLADFVYSVEHSIAVMNKKFNG